MQPALSSIAMATALETCGPTGRRILQIHPTLRCNLRCEHCYSSSGPWEHQELDLNVVGNVLSDAADMATRSSQSPVENRFCTEV